MFPGFRGTKRQQNLLRLYISWKNANYIINKSSRQTTCLQYLIKCCQWNEQCGFGKCNNKISSAKKSLEIED